MSDRSDEYVPEEPALPAPQLDPAQVEFLRQRLESEQNLPLALAAGLLAALLGAAAWAGITVATGYQIGFMAIGIGFLVGYGVRVLGKGVSAVFGVIGATFSLFGCALGNLLAVTAFVAAQEDIPFLSLLEQLDVELAQQLMIISFSPIDLLFYAIALYYGYSLAFRQITPQEIDEMLMGGGAQPLV